LYVLDWLNLIKPNEFDFEFETDKAELTSNKITKEYIDFDLWWKQLDQLKQSLASMKVKID